MNTNSALLLIAFVILLAIVAPFAVIWSLNTLFALSIPFSLKTWLAAFFLLLAMGGIKMQLSKKY